MTHPQYQLSMIDALQILATCIPQHHKSILPRVKMDISVHTKFASSSEFESNSNALIFNLIRYELSELHEFTNCTWKWKISALHVWYCKQL